MVSLEAFSELLEVLYSAPLQQEQWENFLTLVSHHTQSQIGVFLCANSGMGLSILAQGGSNLLDGVDILAYKEKLAPNDPFRGPALRIGRPGILQGEDLLPNQSLLNTDLYRQVLGPKGYRFATVLMLSVTVRRLEVMSLYRSIEQGPMPEDCNRFLNLLLPHIQKALEIRQVLGVAQQKRAGAEAMADSSATATFLLDRQGRVLHQNAAAESLLQRDGALVVRDGMLTATGAGMKEPLHTLFYEAVVPASQWSATPARALSLARGSWRPPLQLLASPLPALHQSRSNADLLLLVTDSERPVNYPDEVLRALYGLTPAQTEVANGILTGYTLEEIAVLRKVSIGTVRQQVKAILSKTGTDRQSDLVRVLMTLPQAASLN